MKGYASEEGTIVDDERVVEDKVVIEWDPEAKAWIVTRTTVSEQVHRKTARLRSRRGLKTYLEAERMATTDHGLPIYLRGDDRERAQDEVAPDQSTNGG